MGWRRVCCDLLLLASGPAIPGLQPAPSPAAHPPGAGTWWAPLPRPRRGRPAQRRPPRAAGWPRWRPRRAPRPPAAPPPRSAASRRRRPPAPACAPAAGGTCVRVGGCLGSTGAAGVAWQPVWVLGAQRRHRLCCAWHKKHAARTWRRRPRASAPRWRAARPRRRLRSRQRRAAQRPAHAGAPPPAPTPRPATAGRQVRHGGAARVGATGCEVHTPRHLAVLLAVWQRSCNHRQSKTRPGPAH